MNPTPTAQSFLYLLRKAVRWDVWPYSDVNLMAGWWKILFLWQTAVVEFSFHPFRVLMLVYSDFLVYDFPVWTPLKDVWIRDIFMQVSVSHPPVFIIFVGWGEKKTSPRLILEALWVITLKEKVILIFVWSLLVQVLGPTTCTRASMLVAFRWFWVMNTSWHLWMTCPGRSFPSSGLKVLYVMMRSVTLQVCMNICELLLRNIKNSGIWNGNWNSTVVTLIGIPRIKPALPMPCCTNISSLWLNDVALNEISFDIGTPNLHLRTWTRILHICPGRHVSNTLRMRVASCGWKRRLWLRKKKRLQENRRGVVEITTWICVSEIQHDVFGWSWVGTTTSTSKARISWFNKHWFKMFAETILWQTAIIFSAQVSNV